MNKRELVLAVREGLPEGATVQAAEDAVNEVLGAIQAALVSQGKVAITGFGIFEVKGCAARKGRNPKTGAPIRIPAKKAVRFRPGEGLKKSINR